MERVIARYRILATLFLLATLGSGLWLRLVLVRSDLLGSWRFGDAVHAHSHMAFFGWVSMALFGLILAGGSRTYDGRNPERPLRGIRGRVLGWHPELVAGASVLAFVLFLRSGYSPASIAISVLHVGLWFIFAAAVWPLVDRRPSLPRRFGKAALGYLVIAGAGTLAPALVMVRGVADPWWSDLSIGLFLVPFVSGWMTLGVMGAIYARAPRSRLSRIVLLLVAAGALPSVLAYPGSPAPARLPELVGRSGMLLLGSGMLLFGWDVLRQRVGQRLSFVDLAALCGAVAGGLQVALALGVAAGLAHRHPVVVAFLHLVLLGCVSPGLVACLEEPSTPWSRSGGPAPALPSVDPAAASWATGLALMLGAIVIPALGPVAFAFERVGLGYQELTGLAAGGGAVVALAGVSVVPRLLKAGGPGPDTGELERETPPAHPSSRRTSATSSSERPVVAKRITP